MLAGGVDAPLAPGIFGRIQFTDGSDHGMERRATAPPRVPSRATRSGMVLGEGSWIYVLGRMRTQSGGG